MDTRRSLKLRNINLDLLLAFDSLLREKHVTRAAERLDISQSSMSLNLAKLRELFNDELLMRSRNGLMPTERALEIWPRIQEAVSSIEEVFEPQATFDPASATDVFRMIVIDYLDMILMPTIMHTLRERAPQVKLNILQPRPHQFGDMMAAGELDLVMTYFPHPPEFLKAKRLFSDRFVGLRSRQHPVDGATLTARQFCALPHATIEPDSAQIYNVEIDAALDACGLKRNVHLVKANFLTLAFIVEKTDIVTCVPERLARRVSRFAAVEQFEIPLDLPAFDVRMMWHPRTSKSPAHEWLRALVAECAHAAVADEKAGLDGKGVA